MKINRSTIIFAYILVTVYFCAGFKTDKDGPLESTQDLHVNLPRRLRIFSKGPDPASEKEEGYNLRKHFRNVMKGGNIGLSFEMNLKDRFPRIYQIGKRLFPFIGGEKKAEVPFNIIPPEIPEGKDWGLDDDESVGDSRKRKDLDVDDFAPDIDPRLKPENRIRDRDWEKIV